MKFKQSVNVLMIALFVWAFQSSTIHFQHSVIDEISECSVCHTSENLDISHHNSSVVIVSEHLAVKSRKHVEKIVVKSRFDCTQIAPVLESASADYVLDTVTPISLGYYATAPPYTFS